MQKYTLELDEEELEALEGVSGYKQEIIQDMCNSINRMAKGNNLEPDDYAAEVMNYQRLCESIDEVERMVAKLSEPEKTEQVA